jgi:protein tyrosine phosphatase (PTP) superfamily phosphohydrolase (DUF442 family)
MKFTTLQRSALAALILISGSCHSASEKAAGEHVERVQAQVTAPIDLDARAYDLAMSVELPPVEPLNFEGLLNVFHLSGQIISGSEPNGDAAFAKLVEMGVRTIVSVDGKAPEAERAAALGMRYVHIPIQYSDISTDEMLRLSKTFRELDGPFYVHCFHGRHRGPAGAEVGRLVLDGIARNEAIAEMRQYCGTSKKYEGLYRLIAAGDVPTALETAAYEYDFTPREVVDGVVPSMVILSRAFDNNEVMMESGWVQDPAHPDLDPVNEAQQLLQGFEAGEHISEVRTAADDFRSWWSEGQEESALLLSAVRAIADGDEGARALADRSFRAVQASCTDCHGEYRNE